MVNGLDFHQPPHTPERGKRVEMKLIIDKKIPIVGVLETWQVGVHSTRTEAPVLRTLPVLALRTSLPGRPSASFIMPFNELVHVSISPSPMSYFSK